MIAPTKSHDKKNIIINKEYTWINTRQALPSWTNQSLILKMNLYIYIFFLKNAVSFVKEYAYVNKSIQNLHEFLLLWFGKNIMYEKKKNLLMLK